MKKTLIAYRNNALFDSVMSSVIEGLNLSSGDTVIIFPQGTSEYEMKEKLENVVKNFNPQEDLLICDETVSRKIFGSEGMNIKFKKKKVLDAYFQQVVDCPHNNMEETSNEEFIDIVKKLLAVLNSMNKKIVIIKECLDNHLTHEMSTLFRVEKNCEETNNNFAQFINTQLKLNARIVETFDDVDRKNEFVIIDRHAKGCISSMIPQRDRLLLPIESAINEAEGLGKIISTWTQNERIKELIDFLA